MVTTDWIDRRKQNEAQNSQKLTHARLREAVTNGFVHHHYHNSRTRFIRRTDMKK